MTSTINTLTDEQAVTVLALVLDYQRRWPDPGTARELDAQIREAATQPVQTDNGTPAPGAVPDGDVTAGALARDTLSYLMTQQSDLTAVVERATAMAHAGMDTASRFDPVTMGVGALVVLALQTEVQVERGTTGKWSLKVHKKAMSDSTLGKLLGKLIASYTGGTGT
jgi:hypothetical protein